MKNITNQYNDLLEGKMTQSQFLRNARMSFPNIISSVNSFKDTVNILKKKKILTEKQEKDLNKYYDPQQLDFGTKEEMEHTDDPKVARKIAMDHLDENPAYYSRLHLAGLDKESESLEVPKNKNRTDLPIEVKKNNFVDKNNEMKPIKESLVNKWSRYAGI